MNSSPPPPPVALGLTGRYRAVRWSTASRGCHLIMGRSPAAVEHTLREAAGTRLVHGEVEIEFHGEIEIIVPSDTYCRAYRDAREELRRGQFAWDLTSWVYDYQERTGSWPAGMTECPVHRIEAMLGADGIPPCDRCLLGVIPTGRTVDEWYAAVNGFLPPPPRSGPVSPHVARGAPRDPRRRMFAMCAQGGVLSRDADEDTTASLACTKVLFYYQTLRALDPAPLKVIINEVQTAKRAQEQVGHARLYEEHRRQREERDRAMLALFDVRPA